MQFELDDLNEYIFDPVIEDRHGKRRWSEAVTCIFRADDGKYYEVTYEEGNTEYQDYTGEDRYPDSYRRESDNVPVVDCPEVEVYDEVTTVKKYRVLPG